MDLNKDYYKILGVLDNAEDIVIKAAYRALAQKYHPDKNQTKAAKDIMQEINEAYSVLSDPAERKKYDGSRKKQEFTQDNSQNTKDLLKNLEKDWHDSIEYFPDLDDLAKDLSRYSKELELTFKILVIEKKEYKNRNKLAVSLKNQFLERYFGFDKEIHNFAEELFEAKDFVNLKKLNRAVTLLGSDIDAEVIINKIQGLDDTKLSSSKKKNTKPFKLARFLLDDDISYYERYNSARDFMKLLGASVEWSGVFSLTYNVEYNGWEYEFDEDDFFDFAIKQARLYLKKSK
jgi:hypothetical protein